MGGGGKPVRRGHVTQDALAFEESRGGDGEEQVRCELRRRRKRQRLKRSKRTVMRLRAKKKKKQEGVLTLLHQQVR